MSDRTLVLAVFDSEADADAAASRMREWQITEGDAIGVLAVDDKGRLKVDKVGARSTGKGAGIGAALWLLGPVGAVAGVAGGAAVGALHHKGLTLNDADRARLETQLLDGKAAVGVLAEPGDVGAVTTRLGELGGKPESHEVSEEELQASAAEERQGGAAPGEMLGSGTVF